MKLNELDHKDHAKKALKENFDINFNVSALDKIKTKTMLTKVKGLISESKNSTDFYKNQSSPAYMKLVFMEQALSAHYKDLLSKPSSRIVVENEEVEKSQVILAAQDMIDSVQKMIEDISDMQVKELPALVSSIQSEIGVNESNDFDSKVSEALTSLSTALQSSRTELNAALGIVTGQAPDDDFGAEDAGDDMDAELDVSGDDTGMDMASDLEDGADDLDLDLEEPEEPANNVGRALR
jgi:hypothetical protein